MNGVAAAEERVPHVAGRQTVTKSKHFWPTSSRSGRPEENRAGRLVAFADYGEICRGLGDKQGTNSCKASLPQRTGLRSDESRGEVCGQHTPIPAAEPQKRTSGVR